MMTYEPRKGWGAVKPHGPLEPLHTPVPILGIFRTEISGECKESEDCCHTVRDIQKYHMDSKPKGLGNPI